MPNYRNGMIYKIENDKNDLIYFGSTTQGLSRRIAEHRGKHNKCMSKKLEVDLKFCRIILVEKFPCDCIEELRAREAYYIRNFPCVNQRIPGRTPKEYREENKEILKIVTKEYKEKNKEKISEKNKEYFQKNKEKISEKQKIYREENRDKFLEQKKEYWKKNRDKFLEQKKEWRKENKEKIKEYFEIKYTCEKCGSTLRKHNKARHEKTKKHINSLN